MRLNIFPFQSGILLFNLRGTCAHCLPQTLQVYLHSFRRCCLQSHEITRNSDKIWPYGSSRSPNVIDLCVNRKPIWDFLLLIISNCGRICCRFRDIDA